MRLSTVIVSIAFMLAGTSAALPVERENMLVARFANSDFHAKVEARAYDKGLELYARGSSTSRVNPDTSDLSRGRQRSQSADARQPPSGGNPDTSDLSGGISHEPPRSQSADTRPPRGRSRFRLAISRLSRGRRQPPRSQSAGSPSRGNPDMSDLSRGRINDRQRSPSADTRQSPSRGQGFVQRLRQLGRSRRMRSDDPGTTSVSRPPSSRMRSEAVDSGTTSVPPLSRPSLVGSETTLISSETTLAPNPRGSVGSLATVVLPSDVQQYHPLTRMPPRPH